MTISDGNYNNLIELAKKGIINLNKINTHYFYLLYYHFLLNYIYGIYYYCTILLISIYCIKNNNKE